MTKFCGYHTSLTEAGQLTSTNFPILSGLSVAVLTLEPGQLLVPHWHPDASELAYFSSGTASVAIFGPKADDPPATPFDVTAGDVVFFPQGYIHYVHNVGKTDVVFTLTFDSSDFDTLPATEAFQSLPTAILGQAFDVDQDVAAELQKGGVIVPPYPPKPKS